jgi:DedD protein
MGLLSLFQRKTGSPAEAAPKGDPIDAVQQARTRARRRLIGALVLVGIGVVGFPLVFETQPRPIPVDIPIDIPKKDGAPPLAMPPRVAPDPVDGVVPTAPHRAERAEPPVITESRSEAGVEASAAAASSSASKRSASASQPTAVGREAAGSTATSRAPERTAVAADDGGRAKALLEARRPEGSSAAASSPGRYIVQVGAFADATSAREARTRVEKLGLRTYTQIAETSAGSRIRVRVGPYASRSEADKALARARGAGLAAVVLTL